jgi:hypothetical protein
VQTLTVEAATFESARAFCEALAGFEAELIAADGIYRIKLTLGNGDKDTLAALNAIERYVTDRRDGPARIEMGGSTYTLHPAPEET